MNVQPIDLGLKLRQGVEPRLDLAPVVTLSPNSARVPSIVASGTPCVASATVSRSGHFVAAIRRSEVDQRLVRNVDTEWGGSHRLRSPRAVSRETDE